MGSSVLAVVVNTGGKEMKKTTTLIIALFSMTMCFGALAEDIPAKLLLSKDKSESANNDKGDDFDFEIVYLPTGEIVTESILDNIDFGERLRLQRPNWYRNPEFYLSTEEREEIEDDTFDAFVNAGEDLLSYRVEHSRITLLVLRWLDSNTACKVEIENRQPDGPGTPNEFSVDVSIQWKKLFGLKPREKVISDEESEGRKKKYEFDWGSRISGLSKPPAMRFEWLFANGGKPIETDLTADPFDSEIELTIKRLHSPQGTDIRFFLDYGKEKAGTGWRLQLNDSLSFRPSGGWDYGNGGPFASVEFQASFSNWRDVFRKAPTKRTTKRRNNLRYAAAR